MRSRYGEGGGGLASRFYFLFSIGVSHEIPHSYLEYGTGLTE